MPDASRRRRMLVRVLRQGDETEPPDAANLTPAERLAMMWQLARDAWTFRGAPNMLNPDFRDMLSAFIAERVEFLVVGAYALAAHGIPRATGDLDFWIRRTPQNADRALRALAAFGAPTQDLTTDDILTPELVVQFGLEPNRIDLLTSIAGVTFEEAWSNRVVTRIDA